MNVCEHKDFDNHEQVTFCYDKHTGLKAIIAIHDTRLGPALGGCRLYNYASEEEALSDVLKLSRGMTYKSSISGLNFGMLCRRIEWTITAEDYESKIYGKDLKRSCCRFPRWFGKSRNIYCMEFLSESKPQRFLKLFYFFRNT